MSCLHVSRRRLLAGAAGLAIAPRHVLGHQYYAHRFTLIHPWTDPTPSGQTQARVYFRFEDVTETDRLLGARAFYAQSAELRASTDDAEPPLSYLEVPAGSLADFSPGHPHVLLKGLTMPLIRDRSYPLTLEFEKSGLLLVMMSMAPID
ncbi:MAG: copper chaperone PCu(A)C [Betaproteobacteria bacterium]|nr:copper chaperone PCu(A)C [Betaproteobacteria bacterium]